MRFGEMGVKIVRRGVYVHHQPEPERRPRKRRQLFPIPKLCQLRPKYLLHYLSHIRSTHSVSQCTELKMTRLEEINIGKTRTRFEQPQATDAQPGIMPDLADGYTSA